MRGFGLLLYGGVIEVVGGRWSFVVRGVGLVAGSLFMGCGSSFRFVDQVAAGPTVIIILTLSDDKSENLAK